MSTAIRWDAHSCLPLLSGIDMGAHAADQLAAWLANRGDVENLSTDGDVAGFSHTGDEQSEADLLKEMIEQGFRVAAFGSQQRSLEDVFMQVTEGLVS